MSAKDVEDHAVALGIAATRYSRARLPEDPARLNLDPLVYVALREELGVSRLSRKVRADFDARVAARFAEINRLGGWA